MYGIQSKSDNIGHDAHLGGALIGMLIAILMRPTSLMDNDFTILLILVPTSIFIIISISKPHLLLLNRNIFEKPPRYYDIDHKYNEERVDKQKEIDRILEKVSKKGFDSLSNKELKRLNELSKN